MIQYQALIEKDGASYSVSFPDLPGCFSSGDSREAAAENARDRIGAGPWQNADGVAIAESVDELHGDNNLDKRKLTISLRRFKLMNRTKRRQPPTPHSRETSF